MCNMKAFDDETIPDTETLSLTYLPDGVHAFLSIRTRKFCPSLIVLEFLHNLSLNCS